MTMSNEDPGPIAELEGALATFKTAILEYFAKNPIDEAHQQLGKGGKDEFLTQVLARIEQTPDVAAQAAAAHATAHGKGHKQHDEHEEHTEPKGHAQQTQHAPARHQPAAPATPAKSAAPAKAAQSAKGHHGGELSGPEWADRFPQRHGGLDELSSGFGEKLGAFKAAMETAGITVHVIDTIRSHPRAYLMHWSYLIKKAGAAGAAAIVAQADADRFEGVDIRWTHTKEDGSFDAAASVKAATELAARFDLDPKLTTAPARNSRHVTGDAIDMTTEWGKENIKILNHDNVAVEITSGPHSGMNPTLWEVGKTYGVWHYGTWSSDMSAPAHDRNHWSTDGH